MDRLKDEWAEFLKEQQRLKEEVDEEHNKAIGELSTKYCEMQKELTKFPPFWSVYVCEGVSEQTHPLLVHWCLLWTWTSALHVQN